MKFGFLLAMLVGLSPSCYAWSVNCHTANGESVSVSRNYNLAKNKGYIKINEQFFLGIYSLKDSCRDGQPYFVYRPESKSVVIFRCDNGTLSVGAYDRDNLWCE